MSAETWIWIATHPGIGIFFCGAGFGLLFGLLIEEMKIADTD